MATTAGFRLPHLCLPAPGVDLARWAVVACDQYTSEAEYWATTERLVGDAPSTLSLIFPEVYLEHADAPQRIGRIQAAMQRMVGQGVLVDHAGAVLVERRIRSGTRRGLMLELDLECYDFSPDSTSLIRPTEGTIVARLAPRMAVRREAALELPHILVLIDDPSCTVIEPLAAARASLAPLYATELMQGGGQVAGYAVDAARADGALAALAALASPAVFEPRYGVPPGTPPMLFAVGDGNHSLATAKAVWEECKARVGMDHPSRWALVEVENIHDPALHFEPIHRVLFGVRTGLREALAQALGARLHVRELADGDAMRAAVQAASAKQAGQQAIGLVEPGGRFAVLEVSNPPAGLAVGTLQPVVDALLAQGAASQVDYVHGDDVLERLGGQPACAGFHLPTLSKHELLSRVVHDGPLPRKTFSMGEAHEKRYYIEARRIR